MQEVNVGIIGLGNVGMGTLGILAENAGQIALKLGFHLRIDLSNTHYLVPFLLCPKPSAGLDFPIHLSMRHANAGSFKQFVHACDCLVAFVRVDDNLVILDAREQVFAVSLSDGQCHEV